MNDPLFVLVFYSFSAVLIGLALLTVFAKRIFHAALALTGALGLVGGFFALLGADFLAAAQLLIYVGGIMIVMLFVIMLSQSPIDKPEALLNGQKWPAAVAALLIGGLLIVRFRQAFRTVTTETIPEPTTHALGRFLLTDWRVPFEVVSLVLLAALVGAVLFAKKEADEQA